MNRAGEICTVTRIGRLWDAILVTNDGFGVLMCKKVCAAVTQIRLGEWVSAAGDTIGGGGGGVGVPRTGHVCIYIYIERERARERPLYIYIDRKKDRTDRQIDTDRQTDSEIDR